MPAQQDTPSQPPENTAEMGTTSAAAPHGPAIYDIRLKGHLHPRWSAWFDQMSITLEDTGDTLLTGPIIDQAALHGILTRIRDLGLPLISVMEIDPAQVDGADGNVDTPSHKETNP